MSDKWQADTEKRLKTRRKKLGKRVFAILEPEEEYARLLLDFIKEKKDFLFETRVFTKPDALLSYMKEKPVDILLASKTSNYGEAAKKAAFTILLAEEQYVGELSHPMIYKFQSAEHILREVFDIYLAHHGDSELRYLPKEGHKNKKYVFFSPYGGVGKTTAAITSGFVLSEKNSVLVINLEMFSKSYFWENIPGEETVHGVSEILYYMAQSHCDLEMKIKSMVISIGNVDYLSGVSNLWDLQNMQEGDMYQLLYALEKYTGYDVIIFDVSFLSKGVSVLFEECTNVIIPSFDERHTNIQWQKSFTKREQEILNKKTKTILLPKIEYMKELTDFQYLAQGAYGEEIRKILSEEKVIYEMRTND